MTDETLRQLQRAFESTGAEADELAWLQARVRAGETLEWGPYSRLAELDVEAAADYLRARVERGDLEQEKLELAAYSGHEPARVLLGQAASSFAVDFQEDEVGSRLSQDQQALVCIRIAAAECVLPLWEGEFAEDARPADAIRAAKAWLTTPSVETEARALRASRGANHAAVSAEGAPRLAGAYNAAVAASAAADVSAGIPETSEWARLARDTERRPDPELESAIRTSLIAWSLGLWL